MSDPNFLFIGPDKSGSTWLYEVLRAHPQAYVPVIKDIYFFDREYARGLSWYRSHFAEAPPSARAIGELSHDYLFSPVAASRIRQHLPNATLLTTLREPISRAFSHYLYLRRSGLLRVSFDDAIAQVTEITEKSLYAKHLSVYLALFPRHQVKVHFFEELQLDPRAFARNVLADLGLDPIATLPDPVLPAGRPRSVALASLAKHGANFARSLGMQRLVGRVKSSSLVQELLYDPFDRDTRPQPSQSAVRRLRDLFEPDVRRLERLLSVDLDHWRTDPLS